MKITEIRMRLPVSDGRSTVLAYVTLVFDGAFVVHDLRLIRGPRGPFVAMPDRPATLPCDWCQLAMPRRAKYCMSCGTKLLPRGDGPDWVDVAHPICSVLRSRIQEAVMAEFEFRSRQ